MVSLILAAALLIIGNSISNRGVELSRANEYGSALWASGERRVSVGGVINMIAAVLLVVGVFSLEPPLRSVAIGAAMLWWGRDVSGRAVAMTRESEPGTPEHKSGSRAITLSALLCIAGAGVLMFGLWSLIF
jgi:hypothetical protein